MRNIATELCRVQIMPTRGRAQRQVLKASELEGLEACRLLLRRCEPISTVKTVSKLVDLPGQDFGGDVMDASTDFERRHPWSMTRKKH